MINVSTILSLIVVSRIMEHSNNRRIDVGQEIGKLKCNCVKMELQKVHSSKL